MRIFEVLLVVLLNLIQALLGEVGHGLQTCGRGLGLVAMHAFVAIVDYLPGFTGMLGACAHATDAAVRSVGNAAEKDAIDVLLIGTNNGQGVTSSDVRRLARVVKPSQQCGADNWRHSPSGSH